MNSNKTSFQKVLSESIEEFTNNCKSKKKCEELLTCLQTTKEKLDQIEIENVQNLLQPFLIGLTNEESEIKLNSRKYLKKIFENKYFQGRLVANEKQYEDFLRTILQKLITPIEGEDQSQNKELKELNVELVTMIFQWKVVLNQKNKDEEKKKVDLLAKSLAFAVGYSLIPKQVSSISYTLYSPRRTMVDKEISHFKLGDRESNLGVSFDVGRFKGALLGVDLVINEATTHEEICELISKANEEKLGQVFGLSSMDRCSRISGSLKARINKQRIIITKIGDNQGSLIHLKIIFDPDHLGDISFNFEDLHNSIFKDEQIKKLNTEKQQMFNTKKQEQEQEKQIEIEIEKENEKEIDEEELDLVTDLKKEYLNKKLKLGINGAAGRIGINLFHHIWGNPNFELKQIVVNNALLKIGGIDQQRRLLDLWFFDEIFGSVISNACQACLPIVKGSIYNNKTVESKESFAKQYGIELTNKGDDIDKSNLFLIQSEENHSKTKILYTIEFFKDISRIIIRNKENEIVMNIKIVPRENDPRSLKWQDRQVEERLDIVFESTGRFPYYEKVSGHLGVATDLVILTCPGKGPEWNHRTYVHGVNTDKLRKKFHEISVISGASCTTNGLAGPVKILNDLFGVLALNFTTLHSVTNTQQQLPKQSVKIDAMAFSPNLASTGATRAMPLIGIANKEGKLINMNGEAIRVNTPNGSIISLTVVLDNPVENEKKLHERIQKELLKKDPNSMKGLLIFDQNVLTSNQIIGREGSQIINPKYTQVQNFIGVDGKLHSRVSLQIWYDNEGQYSQQLLRLAIEYRLAQIKAKKTTLQRITLENKLPGSGGFKDTTLFSDLDGAGSKMFLLMIYRLGLHNVGEIPNKLKKIQNEYQQFCENNKEESLKTKKMNELIRNEFNNVSFTDLIKEKYKNEKETNIKQLIKKFYNHIKMYFNGDIGNRGVYILWAYKQLKELKELNLLEIGSIGNHDVWLFMNLMAWHLPCREKKVNGKIDLDYNLYDQSIPRFVFKKLFSKQERVWLINTGLIKFINMESNNINKPKTQDKQKKKEKLQNNIEKIFDNVNDDDINSNKVDFDSYVMLVKNDQQQIYKSIKDNNVGLTVENILQRFHTFTKEERIMILQIAGNNFEERKHYWSKKLHEYNLLQDQWQKRKDIKLLNSNNNVDYNTISRRVQELFDIVKITLPKQSLEDTLWNDLRGVYFGTKVYTGFRALGRMSLKWWEEHLIQLELLMPKQITLKNNINIINAWKELRYYVKMVVKILRDEYNKQTLILKDQDNLNQKKANALVYRVFQSIFYMNYTSSEWWALDLNWHPNWLESFFENETERIKKLMGNQFDEKLHTINGSNYLNNQNFIDLCQFIKNNFKLFEITETNDLILHGLLPVIEYFENGQIKYTLGFTYRGVLFKGKNIFEGLRIIEDDIYHGRNIREAFDLINSWYADKTTCSKPSHLEKLAKHIDRILESLEIEGRLFIGHISYLEKVYLKNIGLSIINPRLVFTNDGLSSVYLFSGGLRISDLSKNYYSFVNIFGEKAAKEIVDLNSNKFGKFITLKKDWETKISNLDIDKNQIIDWFNNRPALAVYGFQNRFDIKPVLNPIINPKTENGNSIKLVDGTQVTTLENIQGTLINTVPAKPNNNDIYEIILKGGNQVKIFIKKGQNIKTAQGNKLRLPKGLQICYGNEMHLKATLLEDTFINVEKLPLVQFLDKTIVQLGKDLCYKTSPYQVNTKDYFEGAIQVEKKSLSNFGIFI
ncbi:glyceraldehyde-3-phosphate dehydrogenase [Anaeramoeba flamelloides]|uniref:Glyceraldehyde-3-phosphate dehydrogenase n=1 Tax=Anaeramoeba flamelloides TaxID=1746091 RepID=A0ABQ8YSW1_9EUKA|nr:glyceraldehyde-3-phosphate dehydrogenase [Anaeramoeba flamelloides]